MKRTDINKEQFIQVCNESNTMAEAQRKLNMPFKTFRRYAIMFNCYKPNPHSKNIKRISPLYWTKEKLLNLLITTGVNIPTFKLKIQLLKYGIKINRCEICGIEEWNGKPLNMELHHIDGNPFNNVLSNLQMICPNCHAQTDNFRAKNRLSKNS